jgi:hypothetical protein
VRDRLEAGGWLILLLTALTIVITGGDLVNRDASFFRTVASVARTDSHDQVSHLSVVDVEMHLSEFDQSPRDPQDVFARLHAGQGQGFSNSRY